MTDTPQIDKLGTLLLATLKLAGEGKLDIYASDTALDRLLCELYDDTDEPTTRVMEAIAEAAMVQQDALQQDWSAELAAAQKEGEDVGETFTENALGLARKVYDWVTERTPMTDTLRTDLEWEAKDLLA